MSLGCQDGVCGEAGSVLAPFTWAQNPFLGPSRAGSCCMAPARREALPREPWAACGRTQRKSEQFWSREGSSNANSTMLNASEPGCKLLRAEIWPFLGCGRDIYCTPWNRDPDYGCSCSYKNDKWDVFLLRFVLFFLYHHHLCVIGVRKKLSHLWGRSGLPTAKLLFSTVV